MAPEITCPNCHKPCPGLFSNESYGVRHCGCFYQEEPRNVAFHAWTAVPLPEFIVTGIHPSAASRAERGLAARCLEALPKGWDEAVQGLLEASVLGAGHPIVRAYVARIYQHETGYGAMDLVFLRDVVERIAAR